MAETNQKLRISFGKRVRLLRRTADLSQEELAEKAGVHRTYISLVERAEVSVSIDNAAKIAKVFKLSLPDLFKGL